MKDQDPVSGVVDMMRQFIRLESAGGILLLLLVTPPSRSTWKNVLLPSTMVHEGCMASLFQHFSCTRWKVLMGEG